MSITEKNKMNLKKLIAKASAVFILSCALLGVGYSMMLQSCTESSVATSDASVTTSSVTPALTSTVTK